jgi:hypothetical protein
MNVTRKWEIDKGRLRLQTDDFSLQNAALCANGRSGEAAPWRLTV